MATVIKLVASISAISPNMAGRRADPRTPAPGPGPAGDLPGQGDHHSTPEHHHELLGAGLANKRMVPFRSRIKARKNDKLPPWYRHDAEEFIFVLEGEVVLHSEHYAPTDLRPGDSVYLDGRMGHCFVAKGDADAIVLFVLAQ